MGSICMLLCMWYMWYMWYGHSSLSDLCSCVIYLERTHLAAEKYQFTHSKKPSLKPTGFTNISRFDCREFIKTSVAKDQSYDPVKRVFPKIGVGPQNGWWKSWKTLLKWMIWGGKPTIFGNTQIGPPSFDCGIPGTLWAPNEPSEKTGPGWGVGPNMTSFRTNVH